MAALQDPGQGLHSGQQPDGIIQDINRHAAVVMEGLPGDQAGQQTAADVAQAVHLARQVHLYFPLFCCAHVMTSATVPQTSAHAADVSFTN